MIRLKALALVITLGLCGCVTPEAARVEEATAWDCSTSISEDGMSASTSMPLNRRGKQIYRYSSLTWGDSSRGIWFSSHWSDEPAETGVAITKLSLAISDQSIPQSSRRGPLRLELRQAKDQPAADPELAAVSRRERGRFWIRIPATVAARLANDQRPVWLIAESQPGSTVYAAPVDFRGLVKGLALVKRSIRESLEKSSNFAERCDSHSRQIIVT